MLHTLVMGNLFSHAKHHCISKTKHHMYNLKLLELENTQVLSSLNCILHILTLSHMGPLTVRGGANIVVDCALNCIYIILKNHH
jgi:hypothetical protein